MAEGTVHIAVSVLKGLLFNVSVVSA